ncbi:MAG: 2-oxoacid:acceptor oxidoreductase family protein [Coriobacteriaceae bacterium]|jgi:indolepyruvate ferredoxin oxidoreductase beta subunit|nr:2-oxoacid:acceptor oxidoreductase family protein [Coriobacteriaceae bacterium]
MINIILTGIGGQGTVLAAKILAQAAKGHGWKVRSAETIGMAQRGGSVVSHVRIGNQGEEIACPLVPLHHADLLIAFEPAEAVRVLPYLSRKGLLVTASSGVQPVSAALAGAGYDASQMIGYLEKALDAVLVVDDESLCAQAGSRKVLNTILLAKALQFASRQTASFSDGVAANEWSGDPATNASECAMLTIADLREAVRACVKGSFVPQNLAAIDIAMA